MRVPSEVLVRSEKKPPFIRSSGDGRACFFVRKNSEFCKLLSVGAVASKCTWKMMLEFILCNNKLGYFCFTLN